MRTVNSPKELKGLLFDGAGRGIGSTFMVWVHPLIKNMEQRSIKIVKSWNILIFSAILCTREMFYVPLIIRINTTYFQAFVKPRDYLLCLCQHTSRIVHTSKQCY